MCFDFLYKVGLKRFTSQKQFSEILSSQYTRPHVGYPLLFSDFNEINYFDRLPKTPLILNYAKFRPVGAECSMRKGGQTDRLKDMAKLIIAYGNSAKEPKINYKEREICDNGVQSLDGPRN
jgi:hypothetical protein